MMTELEALRDAMAAISGVSSCKIGIEPNIGPTDYPMIRIVPQRITPGKPYHGRTAETLIYFGAAIATSEGLESVYEALFDLEAEILAVLRTLGVRTLDTVTDEDRLDAYKLMVLRCEITTANVAP